MPTLRNLRYLFSRVYFCVTVDTMRKFHIRKCIWSRKITLQKIWSHLKLLINFGLIFLWRNFLKYHLRFPPSPSNNNNSNINHIDTFSRSYRNNTGYNRTFYEAIRPLISSTVLFISSTWWAVGSPHMIMHKESRIFFSAIGATFSNIAVCIKNNGLVKLCINLFSVVLWLHKWHQPALRVLIIYFIYSFLFNSCLFMVRLQKEWNLYFYVFIIFLLFWLIYIMLFVW